MASWYESLFDERYFAFYEGLLPVATADIEAAFIDRALSLRQGARVLDLGCGFGRHAVPLAKLGYRVTGVDLSAHMLDVAASLARRAVVDVDWVRRDVRELAGLGPFDACVCLYTVFGYFSDEENARVLRGVRDVLAAGGRFMLDVDNPVAMLRGFRGEHWRETAHGVTRERSTYDAMTARLRGERTLFARDGSKVELPPSVVRIYAPHELAKALHVAGFEVEQVHGALADRRFDALRSERQVWVATAR